MTYDTPEQASLKAIAVLSDNQQDAVDILLDELDVSHENIVARLEERFEFEFMTMGINPDQVIWGWVLYYLDYIS